MSKIRLAELLWPGVATAQALDSLYKVCRFIRGLARRDIHIPLISQRGELSLDMDRLECDLYSFERLAEAQDDPEGWARAAALYAGPVLAEDCFEWSPAFEAYYEMRHLELLERLADHYRRCGLKIRARYYTGKIALCLGE